MRRHLHLYLLEYLVIVFGLGVSVGSYVFFGRILCVTKDELAYVSIASAGMLFVIGHMYSRLKDRRDGTRKRAQEIYLEWYSKEMRESRIFVSRWIEVHGKAHLPALSSIEKDAAVAYRHKYEKSLVIPIGEEAPPLALSPHSLDDPELKELHFFRVYHFFERWAQLVRNSDVDHVVASDYMTTYTSWYLGEFIDPWRKIETDPNIKQGLEEIRVRVTTSG